MRLSRTDLVPVLAIVAGGAIGASLSFSFLASSPSADVQPVVHEASVTATPVLTRLEATTRQMERVRITRLSTGIEKALARAQDLAREQRDIEARMDGLAEANLGPGSEAGRRLFDRKQAMYDEVVDLEREIDRLMSESWRDERAAADQLDAAGGTIVDDKLKERIRYSRGLIGFDDREYMREFEAETTRIVEELQEKLESVVRPL